MASPNRSPRKEERRAAGQDALPGSNRWNAQSSVEAVPSIALVRIFHTRMSREHVPFACNQPNGMSPLPRQSRALQAGVRVTTITTKGRGISVIGLGCVGLPGATAAPAARGGAKWVQNVAHRGVKCFGTVCTAPERARGRPESAVAFRGAWGHIVSRECGWRSGVKALVARRGAGAGTRGSDRPVAGSRQDPALQGAFDTGHDAPFSPSERARLRGRWLGARRATGRNAVMG